MATISPAGMATGIAAEESTISASDLGIKGTRVFTVASALVTLTKVDSIIKRYEVTQIVLTFSCSLEADMARENGLYRLSIARENGWFTTRNAVGVKVGKAE